MSPAVRVALLRPLARRAPLGYGPRPAEALITRSQQVKVSGRSVPGRTAAADEAVALRRAAGAVGAGPE
ncbi:hypothetical protein [Micromonospora sp. CPCC 205556]|uniref:hypothetical protein n=1 Tax=Micromonospora sp. CPCC 205556 TaxID=3122398 RepID=UPI002FEF8CE8